MIFIWISSFRFYDLSEGSLTEKSRKIVTCLIEKGRRIDFQIEALGKAHEGQTENSVRNFMRTVQPLWSELEKIKHKLRHWMKSDTRSLRSFIFWKTPLFFYLNCQNNETFIRRTLLNIRENPVSGSDCYIVFPKSYTFGELTEYVHRATQECRPNTRFKWVFSPQTF